MDNATTMIVCQSCKGRLRVPTDQGSLRLTCPVCRASWDWIPPNTFTDERVLPFRCAQTGQQFFVDEHVVSTEVFIAYAPLAEGNWQVQVINHGSRNVKYELSMGFG